MRPLAALVHAPLVHDEGGREEVLVGELEVAAQERDDVVLEIGGQVELVLELELRVQPLDDGVVGLDDGDVVVDREQVAGIGPLLSAQLAGVVEEAAADHLGVLLPGGPGADVVVDHDHALALREEGAVAVLEGLGRVGVANAAPGHAVVDDDVVGGGLHRVEEGLGGGLLDVGPGGDGAVLLERVEHGEEGIALERVALRGEEDVGGSHGEPPTGSEASVRLREGHRNGPARARYPVRRAPQSGRGRFGHGNETRADRGRIGVGGVRGGAPLRNAAGVGGGGRLAAGAGGAARGGRVALGRPAGRGSVRARFRGDVERDSPGVRGPAGDPGTDAGMGRPGGDRAERAHAAEPVRAALAGGLEPGARVAVARHEGVRAAPSECRSEGREGSPA